MKEFAGDDFNYFENVRKLFKQVENTVGKGEIAHYEQFLFFPQCFKKLALQTCKNQGLFGKGLNISLNSDCKSIHPVFREIFPAATTFLQASGLQAFKNYILWKRLYATAKQVAVVQP